MHLTTTYKALKIHSSACTLQNLILLTYSFRADCAHLLRELFNFMKMRTFYKKLPLFFGYCGEWPQVFLTGNIGVQCLRAQRFS